MKCRNIVLIKQIVSSTIILLLDCVKTQPCRPERCSLPPRAGPAGRDAGRVTLVSKSVD